MEELGKEMVRYCGGLPLAIVVLGGLLATKHTFYEWERVQRNIKSYLRRGKDNYEQQGSGVSDVLALSYQDLPYYLKSCFLYLANFPEDYEIPTRPLVQMWVAEGIISEAREETLEDVAEGYLDELIGRCMVQAGRVSSNGRVKTCRLHDLMQDLCSSKAKEENFLEIINLQEVETFSSSRVTTLVPNKVRRRAIYLDQSIHMEIVNRNEGANSNANLNVENGMHLRSLLIFYPPTKNSVHWMMRKLDLKNFKLLRVLSLEGLSLEEKLPRAIGNLIHLKYLSLKYAKLLCFPSSIRNLSCIQTLDLRFVSVHRVTCSKVRDVIGRMKWLRHLCLPQYLNIDDSKVQWDSLSNLETLKNFNATQWAVKDLAHLAKLRKLKINNVKSFKELGVILKPSCPISNILHSLVLDDVSSKIEETDLRQLSICQHLYKLFLGGEINSLPGHHHFPPNLIKLTLWESHLKQDPIPILEKLLNLTTLHLKIDCYFGEEMVFSAHGFPRLKYLHVSYIDYLRRLRVDKGAMPNLKSLTIVRCKSLEMVPEGLRYITTLQALEIKYMHKEFMERLQVINGKEGEDFYKVQHVASISLIVGKSFVLFLLSFYI